MTNNLILQNQNNILNSNINDQSGKIIKKRGRKPKNKQTVESQIIYEDNDTENDIIITHLPITINDLKISNSILLNNDSPILKNEESKLIIESNLKTTNDDFKLNNNIIKPTKNNLKENYNIFIKSENIKSDNQNISNESENKSSNGIYINKINVYNIEIKQETKCWWCKNSFDTPNVILPEHYYDTTFYCIGNFCSYNCAKAYNIDINDTLLWKRESLINLMYYMTYNCFKNIIPAPSWLILKEFGGFVSINEFRKNFETNNSDYILLYPPLISRQMQIEESYKKINSSGPINKIDKLLNKDYSLKRNNPIESSSFLFKKKDNDKSVINLQKIMSCI
jgi:hypothetical protein